MNDGYEKYVQKSNEDIKTNKVREEIKLSLTDKQVEEITKMALEVGYKNPGELIEALIGDLTTWHSNGSDEKMYAEQWYDRAFGIWKETRRYFRYFLFEEGYCIDDQIVLLDNEEEFEEAYQQYVDRYEWEGKELDSKEECISIMKADTAPRMNEIKEHNKKIHTIIESCSRKIILDAGERKGEFEYVLHDDALELKIDDEFFSLCQYIPLLSVKEPMENDKEITFRYIGLSCTLLKK